MTPTLQCEGCGGDVSEANASLERYPGATLAWCPDCAGPSRAEELGVCR